MGRLGGVFRVMGPGLREGSLEFGVLIYGDSFGRRAAGADTVAAVLVAEGKKTRSHYARPKRPKTIVCFPRIWFSINDSTRTSGSEGVRFIHTERARDLISFQIFVWARVYWVQSRPRNICWKNV